MVFGIAAATLLRIVFASVTVQLLQIIGLLPAGGLLWVCWKPWRELRAGRLVDPGGHARRQVTDLTASAAPAPPRKTMTQAVTQIIVADVSMSLDNVLGHHLTYRGGSWVCGRRAI